MVCYQYRIQAFKFAWHYHPEYELTYIKKGQGQRLVGDSYENFKAGDLVLLGSNLPHTWFSNEIIGKYCEAVVLQFSLDFVTPLFHYHELNFIQNLLKNSSLGIRFITKNNDVIFKTMQELVTSKDFEKLPQFILLFQKLAQRKSIELASAKFQAIKSAENSNRINLVFEYVQLEYKNKISLKHAAELLFLSESAFCKFFKRVSGKTFSDYVNEIRTANAAELLRESDLPILQIAFNSGFDSISYFNRVFLKKKLIRPSDYRKKFKKGN